MVPFGSVTLLPMPICRGDPLSKARRRCGLVYADGAPRRRWPNLRVYMSPPTAAALTSSADGAHRWHHGPAYMERVVPSRDPWCCRHRIAVRRSMLLLLSPCCVIYIWPTFSSRSSVVRHQYYILMLLLIFLSLTIF
jgi:hypothetical protein